MVRINIKPSVFQVAAFNDEEEEEYNKKAIELMSDNGIGLLVEDALKVVDVKGDKAKRLLKLISDMENALKGQMIKIGYSPSLNTLKVFIDTDDFSVYSGDIRYIKILSNLFEIFNLPIPLEDILEIFKDLERDFANFFGKRHVKFSLSTGRNISKGIYLSAKFWKFGIGIKNERFADDVLKVLNISPEAKNIPEFFKQYGLSYPIDNNVSFGLERVLLL